MTFANQNTEMWTGDDIRIPSVVVDEDNLPRDITSATFTYTVRDKPGGTELFSPKTVGSGITIDNGPAGLLHIDVVSADTDAASVNGKRQDFIQELEGVIDGGHITCWTGRLRLWKSVSGAGV